MDKEYRRYSRRDGESQSMDNLSMLEHLSKRKSPAKPGLILNAKYDGAFTLATMESDNFLAVNDYSGDPGT